MNENAQKWNSSPQAPDLPLRRGEVCNWFSSTNVPSDFPHQNKGTDYSRFSYIKARSTEKCAILPCPDDGTRHARHTISYMVQLSHGASKIGSFARRVKDHLFETKQWEWPAGMATRPLRHKQPPLIWPTARDAPQPLLRQ